MKNYNNKYSVICLLFCIAEQALVAFSTITIIRIGECIERPERLILWMAAFIVSLFIIFLPRYGYQRFLILAKYDTFQSFIHDFEEHFQFKPYLSKEKEFVNSRKAFFHNEIWNVVNESYDFILDFILTFLNICFNIAVIGFAIERYFIVSYILAFAIALSLCMISKKRAEDLSLDFQNSHVKMNSILLYGWDTIMADNDYNHCVWKRALIRGIGNTTSSGIHRLCYVSSVSGLTIILSGIPIFYVLTQSFLNNNDAAFIAILIVTLPRQVNTIQYLNILISSIMSWNGIRAKIKGLEKAFLVPEDLVFRSEYIDFSNITLREKAKEYKFSSFGDILDWEKLKEPGRITIRGGNGSGKSTLLVGLKTHFQERAYYYSPNMQIYFSNSFQYSMSIGEKVLSDMYDFLKNVQTDILLLDEWDANLDASNIKKMNDFLDQTAQKQCIIEVRHRSD